MDHNPPTAGDLARAQASDNKDKIKKLEERIERLEQIVAELNQRTTLQYIPNNGL